MVFKKEYIAWRCKEMEKFTFSDARVRTKLAGTRLLQADVTASSDEDKALLKRFSLFGPPGIIFFDAAGEENPAVRVIGFQPPERFLASLERASLPVATKEVLPRALPAASDLPATSVPRPGQSK